MKMLEILKQYDYNPPKLKLYQNDKISVKGGRHPLVRNNQLHYRLLVNGRQQMVYTYDNHIEAFELFSHYYLAKGHCVCTGMGFGVRENWLLNKKEVSKITIIEKNEDVLEYHKYIKSPFLEHCEVIIADAEKIKMKCDTLLLDHYEGTYPGIYDWYSYLSNVSKKMSENIECEVMWFWMLEELVVNYANKFNISILSSFNKLKNNNMLTKLPDLDEKTINLFCSMYFSQRR